MPEKRLQRTRAAYTETGWRCESCGAHGAEIEMLGYSDRIRARHAQPSPDCDRRREQRIRLTWRKRQDGKAAATTVETYAEVR